MLISENKIRKDKPMVRFPFVVISGKISNDQKLDFTLSKNSRNLNVISDEPIRWFGDLDFCSMIPQRRKQLRISKISTRNFQCD